MDGGGEQDDDDCQIPDEFIDFLALSSSPPKREEIPVRRAVEEHTKVRKTRTVHYKVDKHQHAEAAKSLLENGFVVINDQPIVAHTAIDQLLQDVMHRLKKITALLRQRGLRPRADRFCFNEVCCRTPGGCRLDMRIQHGAEQKNSTWEEFHDLVDQIVRPIFELLVTDSVAHSNSHIHVDSAGYVVALGGAPMQHFHPDGTACGLYNVFVPLVDVCMLNGPTELLPGSHNSSPDRHNWRGRWDLTDGNDGQLPIAPELLAGQLLVFDYRVLHRGLANHTATERPIAYVAYSTRRGVTDSHNFPVNDSLWVT